MAYTKEIYEEGYSIRVRVLDPSTQTYRRSPIRLNYHRAVMAEMVQAHWPHVVDLLGITAQDRVLVVGAGFGWGVEKLIELTGCAAVGMDTSAYVQAEKNNTEEAEIDAAIIAAGYSPTEGHGLEVKQAAFTDAPRATVPILDDPPDVLVAQTLVVEALGNWPTLIITEDMITDLTDAEAAAWVARADSYGVPIAHLLREHKEPNSKSAEDWHAQTGHTIITIGSYRRVG